MVYERGIATVFGMDGETWERHANPWSVWTRVATLPLLILAIWSGSWIGWWALVPVSAVALWLWVNPRVFPKPRSTDNWASKGVLGERVWLNRDRIPVPSRHPVLPHLLSGMAAIGGVILVWCLVAFDPWPTALGTAFAYLGKLWYVDRMV